MNKAVKKFLEALKASLRQENISWKDMSKDEWRELFWLAKSQQVLPMIYQATYNCWLEQGYSELVNAYFNVVSKEVAIQTIKTSDFLDIYKRLCERGVRPLIVKGLVCRNLYPLPDYRPSVDEDILILFEQFKIYHEELIDFDMRLLNEDEDIEKVYEVAYWKKNKLYIEVHKSLFPEESDAYGDLNRFFEDAHKNAVQEEIDGVQVFTLNYTEHLFYLICHTFKHFLGSGVGIRQVCDIILFANNYGEKIDWNLLLDQCVEISADKFAATIFSIGEKYLTFDPRKACYPEEFRKLALDEADLLNDMFTGGAFGNKDLSRIHSSNITLNAVATQKRGKESKFLVLKTIFPSRKYLMKWYAYLEKYPFLLPLAWISRIFKYMCKMNGTTDSPTESVRIGKERVDLLRKYGVLKEL